MKRVLPLVFFALLPLAAQVQDDPVVAVIEGKEWKKSELESMVKALGPNISRNYFNDKRSFLATFALMNKLANLAESEGLPQQEVHKYRLMYNRMLYLAQSRADAQNSASIITPDDQKKYYEAHKSEYASAKVKVLYLSFNDNPPKSEDPKAKKIKTSKEAETLAAEIVKKARGGANFTELVKQYSDDEDSKAKGGDFQPIRPTDNTLPPAIKSAIFALKAGEVSEPQRQGGGFWIFRLEEFTTQTYDQVKDDIYKTIQDTRFKDWMEDIRKQVKVEFKDDKYLDIKVPLQ